MIYGRRIIWLVSYLMLVLALTMTLALASSLSPSYPHTQSLPLLKLGDPQPATAPAFGMEHLVLSPHEYVATQPHYKLYCTSIQDRYAPRFVQRNCVLLIEVIILGHLVKKLSITLVFSYL